MQPARGEPGGNGYHRPLKFFDLIGGGDCTNAQLGAAVNVVLDPVADETAMLSSERQR
jgi:hypothetical protein